MLKYVVFYAFSVFFAAVGGASAAADCDRYTVMRGDTLRLIAERYYGTRDLSPIIYQANMTVVGENPNVIEIGMNLVIPCRDGIKMPMPGAFLALAAPPPPAAGAAAPRFLAKTGATPFMNQDGSGIIPDILGAALRKGGYRADLGLERIGSSGDILRVSGRDSGALLSFPWIKPECDKPDTLTAQSRNLCQNFVFSDPLYEITLGLFTSSDNALASADAAAEFAGKSFCIPQFHTDDLLRRTGISDLRGALTFAPNFENCIDGVLDGTFDVVVADYQSFKTYYKAEPAVITDIPAFARQTTLHAVAYAQNREALDALELANAGLGQIMASGEWFSIVKQHLSPRTN